MYGGFGLSMTVFLYHGFFKSVPLSLEEAAVIDGANIFQLFFNVVFPLVKPITATVVITNAMWIWNDYLLPFLIIGNNDSKTLTLSLYYAKSLSGQYGNPWELIFPGSIDLCHSNPDRVHFPSEKYHRRNRSRSSKGVIYEKNMVERSSRISDLSEKLQRYKR